MHNWSDEELDRISREAAQRYEPPAPDGGWDALSRRLDVEMPVKDRKRRAFFWLFFAGLLLGGTLYWSTTHRGVTPAETGMAKVIQDKALSQNTDRVPSNVIASDKSTSVPVATDKSTLAGNTISGPVISSTHSAPDDRSSNTSFHNGLAPRVVHGPVAGVPQGTGTDRKSKVKQYQGKVPPAQAGNGDEHPAPARSAMRSSEQSTVASGQEPVASGKLTESDNRKPTTDTQQPTTDTQQPTTDTQQPTPDNRKPTTDTKQPKTDSRHPTTDNRQPSRKPGRWEFSLSIAPDLSAVEFYAMGKAGIIGGGTVGFHISERWTVSTGLFYTIKHYDSPGEAYHLPGYWANNPAIKMKQVNAVCNMWDIPLNIRYDLISTKKTRVFASTGLSSYLMRKEDLHYYYTYNNNPYDRSYVYTKKKDYWFAIANVSAGIEQNLGKGFSLQAEPFAKFSLADVGTGRIRLNSYGLFVGLKYRPFKVVHPHH